MMTSIETTLNQENYYTLSHQLIDRKKIDTLLSPVMIVGSPRSGTTWLQRLLLENETICGGQESYFYAIFNAAFISVNDTKDERKIGLSPYWELKDFNYQIRELWVRTFLPMLDSKPSARVLLEKTPFHALFMDDITKLLPETKFIHLIRDSRSVTASLNAASKGWGSYWAPKSTKKSALEWYRHVKSARDSDIAQDNQRYLEVHYEDLLSDPKAEISRILTFIGLDTDSDSIRTSIENQAFETQKKKGGTGLTNTKGKEIKEPAGFFRKGSADAWKDDLNIFQKVIVWRFTRKLMKKCGYDWNGRNKRL